jgi:hypothetical protein
MFGILFGLKRNRAALEAGVRTVEGPLVDLGFSYEPDVAGTSSRGSFATGRFRRGNIEIGLIVRQGHFGGPSYGVGGLFADHGELIAVLGLKGRERLIAGKRANYVARDGTDAFAALRLDLEELILPALIRSEPEFRAAVVNVANALARRLGMPERPAAP